MALISKPKTWTHGEQGVAAEDLNADFDALYQVINGGLGNSNLAADARISESKIAFNSNSGILDQLKRKMIIWTIPSQLFIMDGYMYAPLFQVDSEIRIAKCRLIVGTPPAEQDIIVDVQYSQDGGANYQSIFNKLPHIGIGENVAISTDLAITTLNPEWILKVVLNQVGTTTPGSDLTVEVC
jgi:hypothetical protein